MRKVELWVAVLRGRQVAGRPHYRRLSIYELIDFNSFLNVQVAGQFRQVCWQHLNFPRHRRQTTVKYCQLSEEAASI